MKGLGGTKSWVVTIGVALLLAFVAVPALSGAANATPGPRGASPITHQLPWAYCGNQTRNNTLTFGNASLSWNATFALCTIFHATNTTPGVQMLEVNRTLGVSISATYSGPAQTMTYHYRAVEIDVAFANVTNDSTVNAAGQPVRALGLLNASTFDQSSQEQTLSRTVGGATASSSLSVNGRSNASVAFSPGLGLIPLSLTNVTHWNSTSVASVSAAWQVDWTWSHTTLNGTTATASRSHSGNLSGTLPVRLTGFIAPANPHPFSDQVPRVGIVLVLQGPFDLRDGFVLVPHDFDMFGGASPVFAANEMGSATMNPGETLYFSRGPGGPRLGAAASSFGADDAFVNQGMMGYQGGFETSGASPAALGMNPTGMVEAQPLSVAQAQAESNQIAGPSAFGVTSHTGVRAVLVDLLVAAAAVVVVLGVVGWRSYARRRAASRAANPTVGYDPNGIPPAVIAPPSEPGPADSVQRPEPVRDPNWPR